MFYFIHTVPDLDKNRIKLGFTENIDLRLNAFRTIIPTLQVAKTWACLRSWELAAIASVTKYECVFLSREVIQCDDYNKIITRCDEFFSFMPNPKDSRKNGTV